MAKKKEQEIQVQVSYADLIASKVQVIGDGVVFYLDPGRHSGEFILRTVPQVVEQSDEELPDEWRKPTVEETQAAENKIDWEIPNAQGEEETPADDVVEVPETSADDVVEVPETSADDAAQ